MILFAAAVPLVMLAVYCALQTARSLGPYAQVLRRPTTPVGSLALGPAEVAGTLRARGSTLTALDGTPAVAVRVVVRYTYKSGSKRYASPIVLDDLETVPLELADGTGACTVDTTSVMLLGLRRARTFIGHTLKDHHPALWDKIPFPTERTVSHVEVDETVVPDGVAGMVSGEVDEEGIEPGGGYRAANVRFRLTASAERPLILAAFGESDARRVLLRPAWQLAWLSAMALASAAMLVVAALMIGD